MKVTLHELAIMNLIAAPLSVQKAFIKQIGYLGKDLRHPSLRLRSMREVLHIQPVVFGVGEQPAQNRGSALLHRGFSPIRSSKRPIQLSKNLRSGCLFSLAPVLRHCGLPSAPDGGYGPGGSA